MLNFSIQHYPVKKTNATTFTLMCRINLWTWTLERECRHFDEIFVTGCTESCQNDNLRCNQGRKFHQNNIFVSVGRSQSLGSDESLRTVVIGARTTIAHLSWHAQNKWFAANIAFECWREQNKCSFEGGNGTLFYVRGKSRIKLPI